MSVNTQWDSLNFEKLDFPYDRIEAELSGEPRLVDGNNAIVTYGGKLCKRPGNLLLENSNIAGRRIDRLWIYETIDTPPKVFICASMYHVAMGEWEMYYKEGTGAWTLFTNVRSINASTQAHEAVVSRGLFYVKGYPSVASGELLGTVMLDGSQTIPTVNYWGILPPTEPASLVGAIGKLSADILSTTTILVINTTSSLPTFPVILPFTIQIGLEQVQATAFLGSSSTQFTWTVSRGYNDTEATSHNANEIVIWRDWISSSHQVDVNNTWAYTYAWETVTGQVSSRAPLETNPDKLPSRTGPFQDLVPKFSLQGYSDTTQVPYVRVFRTTDGGGTYYALERIANPGSGAFVYSDDSFESGTSGGTFNDPVPDSELDTATIAPSLTTNSPPPTVIAPSVVGVDSPVPSTPIVSYAARLWFAIGNILFFSGQEEISLGIPEECWPSGGQGNFFRFQYPITNLQSSSTALYIETLQSTHEITGTNRETFNPKPIFDNVGHPYGHPRAIVRFEDTVVLLTHDLRVAQIQDNTINIISDPLYTDLTNQEESGAEFDIKYFGDLEKSWLFVAGHMQDDSTLSKQWVFDIKKSKKLEAPFWFPPWTMPITAMASGRISQDSARRKMVFAMYDSDTNGSCLVEMDPTGETGSDYTVTDDTGFTFEAVTNLFMVPYGDHVNKYRGPGVTPVVYGFSIDRNSFSGDTDPYVYYYKDDFWTDPIPPPLPVDPPRRNVSKGYKTLLYGVQEVAQKFAVKISKLESKERFEMQNLILGYVPDAGA